LYEDEKGVIIVNLVDDDDDETVGFSVPLAFI
jgi:hypothetical protein